MCRYWLFGNGFGNGYVFNLEQKFFHYPLNDA